MKVVGYIVAVFGVLMLVSSANLARTKYNLQSSDDFQQFCGGLAVSVLILAGGIVLIRRSKPPGSGPYS
jgi:hypothetical protein